MPRFRRHQGPGLGPGPRPGTRPRAVGRGRTVWASGVPRGPGRSTVEDEPDWRTYDSVAETYARVHEPRMALPAADLVAAVGLTPGARVLDVGTGTGVVARIAAEAAGRGGIVVGIDRSLPMLRAADAHGGRPVYALAEAIDLPVRSDTFDVVLASFALSHFRKYDTALFDMLRVLKPGGRMGITTWGPSLDEFQRAWRDVCEEFAERQMLNEAMQRAMPWEERFADATRLKDTLHDAGLRDMIVDRREYRFQMTAEDYLAGREVAASGRFLREMLGPELWERLRLRAHEVFAERFPERFNDFRDVNMVIGLKP